MFREGSGETLPALIEYGGLGGCVGCAFSHCLPLRHLSFVRKVEVRIYGEG
jgi:hypothetical protein